MALTSVLIGVIFAFVFMWPLSLVMLGCLPFLAVASTIQMRQQLGVDESNTGATTNSSTAISSEALLNLRTVSALTLEKHMYRKYENALVTNQRLYMRKALFGGFANGMAVLVQQWVNALLFWLGGYLLFNYSNSFTMDDFAKSVLSLTLSLLGLGAAFRGVSDRKEMEKSTERVFDLLDRESSIDPLSTAGKKEA